MIDPLIQRDGHVEAGGRRLQMEARFLALTSFCSETLADGVNPHRPNALRRPFWWDARQAQLPFFQDTCPLRL